VGDDRILVSRRLLTSEAGMKINTESVEVVKCPSMMNKNGTPRRFGRPSSTLDVEGACISEETEEQHDEPDLWEE